MRRFAFRRDAAGRIVREKQDEEWIESDYDVLGRRIRMRSSLGVNQAIERNVMGDVSRVSEASSGFEARFVRDQLGLELERSLPGGVVSRWRRDTTGRPLQHRSRLAPRRCGPPATRATSMTACGA
jgi:YD repeat-containing protein